MSPKRSIIGSAMRFVAFVSSKKRGEQSAYETAMESLDVRPGPIRSELSPAQIDRIRKLQDVFADVYPVSYGEWLDGFQRDVVPENEIVIWENMASAYTRFLISSDLDAPGRKEAFGLLLVRSATSDMSSEFSKLQHLRVEKAKELVALYESAPQPVTAK